VLQQRGRRRPGGVSAASAHQWSLIGCRRDPPPRQRVATLWGMPPTTPRAQTLSDDIEKHVRTVVSGTDEVKVEQHKQETKRRQRQSPSY
jgi:hypothetical protein